MVKRSTLTKEIKILDYKWVYIYKFNKYGHFIKYKVYLMVREDQQKRINEGEMYIITLAGKNFKTLVVIATRFDLKILQYDTINAFINTPLNKTIYIKILMGYKEKGKVLYLYKALYGLRKLLLLW